MTVPKFDVGNVLVAVGWLTIAAVLYMIVPDKATKFWSGVATETLFNLRSNYGR